MPPQPTDTAPPLDDTPLYRPGDVADVAARHRRTVAGPAHEHRWFGHTADGSGVHLSACHGGHGPFRVQVACGATDDRDDWMVALDYATPAWVLDQLLVALLGEQATATPDEDVDDCAGCEGQAVLDERGLCPGCAHEVDHDPWHVLAGGESGQVVRPGPYCREQAEHVARIHNHGQRYADRGVHWYAARAARRAAAVAS